MPRVKIDYVVSFSSEDPDNPARNLLGWDVSKKRWLCSKGESSCSAVLQLARSVKINAVHIGAHHLALVEVLVGRSETPNEPFQVLVPSCIFLTPAESRREENVERVRSFSAEQLAAGVKLQRWDRLRLVCSQPYNKHCKYGLNFVHIYCEEEGSGGGAGAALAARLRDADASSEDEFLPGELFARHRGSQGSQDLASPATAAADTGAQIRQATSQALKNISDTVTKLVKTPISKHNSKHSDRIDQGSSDRHRDDLMYTDDDDRPHAKIDHVVQRHKDEKTKEDAKKPKSNEKRDRKSDRNESFSKEVKKDDSRRGSSSDRHRDKGERTPKNDKKDKPSSSREPRSEPSTSKRSESDNNKKRSRDDMQSKKAEVELSSILRGAVIALSGYVHPRRGRVREGALRLGARCERDWGPACTHLICAFPNTPKLKQVRAGPGGGDVPVATAEWIEQCYRRRRRLPWRWFATEPRQRLPEPDEATGPPPDASPTPDDGDGEECDTDDEIEKALRKQKKRRTERSRSRSSDAEAEAQAQAGAEAEAGAGAEADASCGSDVEFVRDERFQGNVTVHESDEDATDEDDTAVAAAPQSISAGGALPALFEGRTFVIDASARAFHPRLLARYVRAYGGLVLEESQLDADTGVDYILGAAARARRGAACLRADWLWRCHRARRLCPLDDYLLA